MNHYPTIKVTILYSLLGGFVGGFLFAMMAVSTSDFDQTSNILLFIIAMGTIIGFIPAILTGFILSKLSAVKNQFADYGLMFMVGGVILMLFSLCVSFILSGFDGMGFLFVIAFFMALLGGISSVIVGSLVLPKSLIRSE